MLTCLDTDRISLYIHIRWFYGNHGVWQYFWQLALWRFEWAHPLRADDVKWSDKIVPYAPESNPQAIWIHGEWKLRRAGYVGHWNDNSIVTDRVINLYT